MRTESELTRHCILSSQSLRRAAYSAPLLAVTIMAKRGSTRGELAIWYDFAVRRKDHCVIVATYLWTKYARRLKYVDNTEGQEH